MKATLFVLTVGALVLAGCSGTPAEPEANTAELARHLPAVSSPMAPVPYTGVLRTWYNTYGVEEGKNPGPANASLFASDTGVQPDHVRALLTYLPGKTPAQVLLAFSMDFGAPADVQAWIASTAWCDGDKPNRHLIQDGAFLTMIVTDPLVPDAQVSAAATAAKDDVVQRTGATDACA